MSVISNEAPVDHHDYTDRSVLLLRHLASFGVVALFVTVCVFLAGTLNIWQDEAYSLHTTAAGAFNAWKQAIAFEAQAPLYFVCLALWRSFDASAMNARLLSLAFSLITLYATWDFARRYLKIKPSIVLAAIAFNPFVVWAAVEIRPYAASVAFSAVLLLLFFRGYVERIATWPIRLTFLAVAVAGTYTQYYVASLVLACGVALFVTRRWDAFKAYVGTSIAFGLALIPLAYILPLQFRAYDAFSAAFKIPGYAMATVLLEYPFPHDWIGTWAHMHAENAAYFGATLVSLALIASSAKTQSATTMLLLVIVAVMFAFYTALIAIAHVHVLIPRHSLVLLVPLELLLLAVLGNSVPSRRRLVLGSYLAVYAVFALLTFWGTYHTLSKTGDWRRVAAFVDRHALPADGIAIFNAEAELPFRYYSHSNNAIQAIPRPMSFSSFNEEAFVLHSEREVAQSLGVIAERHRRIWLVESNVCSRQAIFFGCEHLKSYVKSHFRLTSTRTFDGSTVQELQRDKALP